MDSLLLDTVEITEVSPCFAEPDKIRLKARFSDNIAEILPYINAEIVSSAYNPGFPSLTLSREFRVITLYPRKMTIIKAINTTDALQVIDWIKELINDLYQRRDEIKPDSSRTERPHALQIYKLLPGNNCGQCGELTCLAFAVKLSGGDQELDNCKPLTDREQEEIKEMIGEIMPGNN